MSFLEASYGHLCDMRIALKLDPPVSLLYRLIIMSCPAGLLLVVSHLFVVQI
jgi:hypothetical protein